MFRSASTSDCLKAGERVAHFDEEQRNLLTRIIRRPFLITYTSLQKVHLLCHNALHHTTLSKSFVFSPGTQPIPIRTDL